MNDEQTKTKQRRPKGREPSEKTLQLRSNVRCRVLVTKLWHSFTQRCLASTTILNNLYRVISNRLAGSPKSEMEGVINEV